MSTHRWLAREASASGAFDGIMHGVRAAEIAVLPGALRCVAAAAASTARAR